jgi:hypothetical protein
MTSMHRRTELLPSISERTFQEHVMTLAALGGWHGVHVLHSKGNMEGLHSLHRPFPRGADHDDAWGLQDLLLIHPERHMLFLAELKTSRGRLGAEQRRWHAWTDEPGTYRGVCWRPEDERQIVKALA